MRKSKHTTKIKKSSKTVLISLTHIRKVGNYFTVAKRY